MIHDVLHGESGQPIQFGPLGQAIVHCQWTLWIDELRPEELLHFMTLLILKVFGRISCTSRQIQIGVLYTPCSVQRGKLRITEFSPQQEGLSIRNLSGLT